MEQHTFHHHYHILYDLRDTFKREVTYVEIGAFAGGSVSLVLSHPLKTNGISIDIGWPIDEQIVRINVDRFKSPNNQFTYIKGDSTLQDTLDRLKSELGTNLVDILFIDGDHSYNAVISDFKMYSSLVAPGGYIIFDDYLDHEHSPDVKPAVDFIVETMLDDEFIVHGSIQNKFNARPSDLKNLNCFVIQRKQHENQRG
jgi:cephalosporin hydroxylase